MSPRKTPANKEEMLSAIKGGWEEFESFIKALPLDASASVWDDGGWSLKDHIAHIAAWEEMVVAFFEGRPRFAELGLDEASHAADTDLINERIHAHRRSWPVAKVLERSHTAHRKLVGLVEATAESDLMKSLSQFRPGGPSPGDIPVYALIRDNTFGHYDEHMPAMRALAKRAQPTGR